jgi:nucleoside-diphosphate-sugar epimerase
MSGKVLITGIDSFTGYHLSHYLLARGFDVFGTSVSDSDTPQTLRCDITSMVDCVRVLELVQPDYVIHLAGISFVGHADASAFYQVNVLGTENLLRAICSVGSPVKKVVVASSATVYGNQGVEVLHESLVPRPVGHYAISKLAMEYVAHGFEDKLPLVIARPFNYTGIGQGKQFLIPKIVSHFKDKSHTIELGNLYVSREFNHVDMMCEIYHRLLISSEVGCVVNACSGVVESLLGIVDLMNELAGYKIDVQVNPSFVLANEIKSLSGSTDQLWTLIGRVDSVPISKTLSEMYHSDHYLTQGF